MSAAGIGWCYSSFVLIERLYYVLRSNKRKNILNLMYMCIIVSITPIPLVDFGFYIKKLLLVIIVVAVF